MEVGRKNFGDNLYFILVFNIYIPGKAKKGAFEKSASKVSNFRGGNTKVICEHLWGFT